LAPKAPVGSLSKKPLRAAGAAFLEGLCLTFQPVGYAKNVVNGSLLMSFTKINMGNMAGILVARSVNVDIIGNVIPSSLLQ